MTRPRDGYKTVTIQIPIGLWEDLNRRLDETPEAAGSFTRLVCLMLAEQFGRALPRRKKAGPKPKPAAQPKKGRKP
jgi:hypothetical protein